VIAIVVVGTLATLTVSGHVVQRWLT
jgi:hypothetical protein